MSIAFSTFFPKAYSFADFDPRQLFQTLIQICFSFISPLFSNHFSQKALFKPLLRKHFFFSWVRTSNRTHFEKKMALLLS